MNEVAGMVLILIVLLCLALLLTMATRNPEMYLYSDGDVYSCPHMATDQSIDVIRQEGEAMAGDGIEYDPLTQTLRQDFFYDPDICNPFYTDQKHPTWFGRLEDLKQEN